MRNFRWAKRVILYLIVPLLYLSLTAYVNGQEIPFSTTLPNGLKLIVEEDHSAPVVAIQVWVKAGSADEEDREAGIAHLIEHMLFKGTPELGVGEIAKEVDEMGGRINAFTSFDETVYHITIASRFYKRGIQILSDMITRSTFDPEELKRETNVVIEELKRSEDNPSSLLSKRLFGLAYKEHPYRRPVIGYIKTLKRLTRDDVISFYRRWYRPDNMTFVVVGDVNTGEILKEVADAFKGYTGERSVDRMRIAEPRQEGLKSLILYQKIKVARIELAFHIPGIDSPDVYPLDILANILGEGRSSRLYRSIKDKRGLVRSISTYSMTPKDPGLFFISAELEPEKIRDTLSAIFQEIKAIKSSGVTEKELNRAKLNLESEFIYDSETVQGRARQWGYFATLPEDLNFRERYIEGIRDVTGEDIERVVKRYLTGENLTVGIIIPEDAEGVFKKEEIREIALKEGFIKNSEGMVTRRILSNGITLIVKENHTNPTVSIYGTLPGGLITENSKNNGISNLVARMLTRGTTTLTAAEIADRIESMAGSINGVSGRNTLGLSASFLSRFFDKGLKLYADLLINSNFPEVELNKVKQDVLTDIKSREDNLARTTMRLLDSKIYEGHPYSMDPLGSKETIESLTRKDLLEYYRDHLIGSHMVISIVGDIDTDHVISQVEALLRKIKKGRPSEIELPVVSRPKKEIDVVKTKEREQAHIAMGFIAPSLKDPDRYPMEVLTKILSGMGGRLFVELRDKQGLAYVVTAFLTPGYNTGSFVVYMATSPENLKVSISGIKKELERVIEKGVTDEEIRKAKSSLIGNYEIGLQSNSAQASDMALNELLGLGYDYFKRYPEMIQNVSKDDIKRVARRYLTIGSPVLAIIKPPKPQQAP